MPQLKQQFSETEYTCNNDARVYVKNYNPVLKENSESSTEKKLQLDSVMSELNRLSKSFVDSYQSLEGQVEKLNGQLQNETEQKKHAVNEQQKLLGEKAFLSDRLQNLLAIMPAGVVVIDGKGMVKDCNAKAVDILGRPLLGELWINVINRAFHPQADDGHQVSLKDGRKVHIETRALNLEPGQLVLLTDLTKSRQLQAELTQQQKLSSMGKMIASLAHQIRTPLSAAILYGSHLNKDNLEQTVKKKFSNQLLERLHFMERQINDMLSFVKGERKEKSLISVYQLFISLKELLIDFPDFVDIDFIGNQNSEQYLLADKDAVVGAMVNLIDNACDACQQQSNPKVKVTFQLTDKLSVSVTDNGVGLTAESKEKIFEPFYTTKKSGNGLGLAIVHGIIIEHSGRISVSSPNQINTNQCSDSKNDKGAQFDILLPLIKKNSASVTPISLPQEKSDDS